MKNRRRKKKKSLLKRIFIFLLIVAVAAVALIGARYFINRQKVVKLDEIEMPDWIKSEIIEVDGTSRSGEKLSSVKDIVVHYVGNPGSTAEQNRNFYAGDQSNVSSHFVVGLKGEIIQCIPLSEMSAASNWRNNDTISIEVCHLDDTGKFNKKTYKSLVKLVAWLEDQCGLEDGDVIRHYDITGKECPKYFVTHEDAWKKFKQDVADYRKGEQ